MIPPRDSNDRPGTAIFGYAAAVFFSSAGALVVEIVAGRMIAPYVGMSLYTWTAIISVVLGGLSAGHWIGGLLSEADPRRAHRRIAALLAGAAVTTTASLVLIRLLWPLIAAQEMTPIATIVVLSSALFFLPSFFVGAVSPILTRLAVALRPEATGRTIGFMFAAGALGSILGTLAAGYVFISWIGTRGTVLAVAGFSLCLAAVFAWLAARSGQRAAALAAGVLSTFLIGGGVVRQTNVLASACYVESNYYCIRVDEMVGTAGRDARVMVLDHLGHGINDRTDPTFLHSSYLSLIDILLRHRLDPERGFSAFFIGGGANTLPRAWQALYPGARLHIAEIDPEVSRVAVEELWFTTAQGTQLDHRDARVVLASLPPQQRYDVIVGDAFHDISVPQHLTTVEFAELTRRHLADEGFYAINVIDSGQRPLFLYALVLTLARVFPYVEVWLDTLQIEGGGRMTFLAVASNRPSGVMELRETGPDGKTWRRWPSSDLAARLAHAGLPLFTDDFAPVDRLMLHVLAEEP